MTTASFYDQVWERYAALDAQSPAAFHRRRLICDLALRFSPRAERVIDVGCGPGELLHDLASTLPGAQVEGGDVSERGLDAARKRCPRAQVFTLNLEDPSFDAAQRARLGAYDLVVCSEVLEHVEDDEAALARVARLLAPGGHLIATVPAGQKSRFDELIGHRRHYKRAVFGTLLARELEVLELWAWGFPFHNAYRSAVRLAARYAFDDASPSGPDAHGVLGRAYGALGRVLVPLYYMNMKRWGEQLIAVARKP